MGVKVYVSGISGNKEVKKRQQRVLMILDSRSIKYDVVDIAEPGNETQKDFMQNNSTSVGATVSDTNPRHPLPPQIFNDDIYCGDYDQFDMANEIDELEKFLKISIDNPIPLVTSNAEIKLGNGNAEIEIRENDSGDKEEITRNAENTLEKNTTVDKEEQSLQTESETIENTNGETKVENGNVVNESVAIEES
ncbi:hypothetical protein Trydic_g22672 [Trypoxylus dichotomus]